MQPIKKSIGSLEAALQDAQREIVGLQEMLALVLLVVDDKVYVSPEVIQQGFAPNVGVAVVEDQEDGGFWFYLEERVETDE